MKILPDVLSIKVNTIHILLFSVMTDDNFEATYQVTYLAHFLLVSHLLPIMERSGEDCRIVFISSQTHQQADFDATYASGAKIEKHNGFQCFANSNLFQVGTQSAFYVNLYRAVIGPSG